MKIDLTVSLEVRADSTVVCVTSHDSQMRGYLIQPKSAGSSDPIIRRETRDAVAAVILASIDAAQDAERARIGGPAGPAGAPYTDQSGLLAGPARPPMGDADGR